MRYILIGSAALMIAGAAAAQPAPADPPARDPAPNGEHGPGMGMHGRHEMMQRMLDGGKAAHFMFRRGDSRVDIKCAADEPMKACIEAATTLLDKLAPAAPK